MKTAHQKSDASVTRPTGNADQTAAFEGAQRSLLQRFRYFLHSNPIMLPILILILAVLGFGVVAGERFFSAFTLSLIVQQVTVIGMLAAAQALIIITAGIDLSVAAIMILSSVIMGKLAVNFGVPTFAAIPVGFLFGTLCGVANGLLVTRLRLPPFIVTLGTWNIFFSANILYSGSRGIRSQDVDAAAPMLKFFGLPLKFGGFVLTYGSILMVATFVVLWYVLNMTAWGRRVYAVGDDKDAAELSGIRTDRVLIQVYGLGGLICGIAAWVSIGRVGMVSPHGFFDANLDSITAAVVGGTSLFGGRGSILGALFGALIVGIFATGLKFAGVEVLWQRFALGCLIVGAVALDQWIRRVSA